MTPITRKLLALLLVGFAVFCFWRGLPLAALQDAVSAVESPAVASPATQPAVTLQSRPIEEIRVGQRVLARNPEISSSERRERGPEPDFAKWLHLSLEMPKPDVGLLKIEILRPEEWVRSQLGYVVEERVDEGPAFPPPPPEAVVNLEAGGWRPEPTQSHKLNWMAESCVFWRVGHLAESMLRNVIFTRIFL